MPVDESPLVTQTALDRLRFHMICALCAVVVAFQIALGVFLLASGAYPFAGLCTATIGLACIVEIIAFQAIVQKR